MFARLSQPHEIGTVIVPILQIRRTGHQNVISQARIARKVWSPGFEPGLRINVLVGLSSSPLQETAEVSWAQQSRAYGTGLPSGRESRPHVSVPRDGLWFIAPGSSRGNPQNQEGGGKGKILPVITGFCHQ